MAARDPQVGNNIGALRLLFSYLVIVSHSAELLDGNDRREPLAWLFGTLSSGEFAVDGFFLISGYLITKSFENSGSVLEYILKRVIRIYPGYIVAFLFSMWIIGPLAGGDFAAMAASTWEGALVKMVFLQVPQLPGTFAGSNIPSLNASMWTISYEFRCYLLVALVGSFGLLLKRQWIATGTAIFLALTTLNLENGFPRPNGVASLFGDIGEDIRLTGIFGCGVCFYLFRNRIRLDAKFAALSGALLAVMLPVQCLVTLAVAIFGGYAIFWFAFRFQSGRLSRIGSRVDLSYGVYLYAFPIEKMLILYYPRLSLWLFIIITAALSSLAASLSWRLVEKPFLDLRRLPVELSSNLPAT